MAGAFPHLHPRPCHCLWICMNKITEGKGFWLEVYTLSHSTSINDIAFHWSGIHESPHCTIMNNQVSQPSTGPSVSVQFLNQWRSDKNWRFNKWLKSLWSEAKDFAQARASRGGLEVWRFVQSNDLCFVCQVYSCVLPNGHSIQSLQMDPASGGAISPQWRECFNSTDVKLALSHSYKKYVHLQGVSKNLFEVRLPIVK